MLETQIDNIKGIFSKLTNTPLEDLTEYQQILHNGIFSIISGLNAITTVVTRDGEIHPDYLDSKLDYIKNGTLVLSKLAEKENE